MSEPVKVSVTWSPDELEATYTVNHCISTWDWGEFSWDECSEERTLEIIGAVGAKVLGSFGSLYGPGGVLVKDLKILPYDLKVTFSALPRIEDIDAVADALEDAIEEMISSNAAQR